MGGLAAPCCDKMLVVYNLQCIFFFSLQGYFVFMCPKIIIIIKKLAFLCQMFCFSLLMSNKCNVQSEEPILLPVNKCLKLFNF